MTTPSQYENFFTSLPAVIGGWILVDLWGKVVNLTAYSTLGLNPNSTYHALIIAIICTIIFIAYVICSGIGARFPSSIVGLSMVVPTSSS